MLSRCEFYLWTMFWGNIFWIVWFFLRKYKYRCIRVYVWFKDDKHVIWMWIWLILKNISLLDRIWSLWLIRFAINIDILLIWSTIKNLEPKMVLFMPLKKHILHLYDHIRQPCYSRNFKISKIPSFIKFLNFPIVFQNFQIFQNFIKFKIFSNFFQKVKE
jgi:hypothetical protein